VTSGIGDPAAYYTWYATARGAWIGRLEERLLLRLLRPEPGASLLDVGTGSGHFARRFAARGLRVVGLDPDPEALRYAARHHPQGVYLHADAAALPFAREQFDYSAAVTSLCFIADPAAAVAEMWRVTRRAVVLGLLNRRSLLHCTRADRGARWDTPAAARVWLQGLVPIPHVTVRSALFLPDGSTAARIAEALAPGWLSWGGFLAVCLGKPNQEH